MDELAASALGRLGEDSGLMTLYGVVASTLCIVTLLRRAADAIRRGVTCGLVWGAGRS